MDIDLAQKAITAAIKGNWNEAIELNRKIVSINPNDCDALNRLARAYAECGKIQKGKRLAEKVLRLDPTNTIAAKSILRWRGLKPGKLETSGPLLADAFLEEPGKTKIVSLLCLGDKSLVAKLDSADYVKLAPRGHRVSVTTKDGKYLGRLPDDLSARLKNLIKAGYEYEALIKSIEPNDIKIFIHEIKRSKKLNDVPSFTAEKIDYISYTPPELVTEKENRVYFPDAEDNGELS